MCVCVHTCVHRVYLQSSGTKSGTVLTRLGRTYDMMTCTRVGKYGRKYTKKLVEQWHIYKKYTSYTDLGIQTKPHIHMTRVLLYALRCLQICYPVSKNVSLYCCNNMGTNFSLQSPIFIPTRMQNSVAVFFG